MDPTNYAYLEDAVLSSSLEREVQEVKDALVRSIASYAQRYGQEKRYFRLDIMDSQEIGALSCDCMGQN
jgi:hypothetical protein